MNMKELKPGMRVRVMTTDAAYRSFRASSIIYPAGLCLKNGLKIREVGKPGFDVKITFYGIYGIPSHNGYYWTQQNLDYMINVDEEEEEENILKNIAMIERL